MASQALEAVLSEPDHDASHVRLHELVATRGFRGPASPPTAEKYLRAFCDIASSSTRRRWIGIALAGMIDASLDVVNHLGQLRQELQGLGAIVLSNTEREETKIVAGIIMRQALEQGIEYHNFWVSDKVKHSAPNFPKTPNPRWMAEFQSFLDTLGDLALANPNPDPSIIYPISLVASDGFKWRESNDGFPIALIQAGMLTVIAPDALLRDIQFVDIPINHIQSVQSRRSTLHDSQARTTGHEPWDLILMLKAEPWSYRLDTSKRTGTEVTLLFHHLADAKEWERSIEEHQEGHNDSTTRLPPSAHPLMSSSSPIDLRISSPLKADTVVHLDGKEGTTQSHSSDKVDRSRLIVGCDPKNVSRPRPLPRPPHTEQQHRVGSRRVPIEAIYVHAEQQQDSRKPAKQHKIEPDAKQNTTRAAQEQHVVQSRQNSHNPSSAAMLDGVASMEHTESVCPTPKRTTYSKGKLPRVSRAAKLKSSKQLHAQSDVFDIPSDELEQETAEEKTDAEDASSARPTTQRRNQRSKVANPKTTGNTKGRQSQAKRKADDDDDFVPDVKRPRMNTNTRRKPASVVVQSDNQPRNKARKPTEDVKVAKTATKPTKTKASERHLAPVESNGATKVSRPRVTKPKFPEQPASSIASSRYSLIGGLLGSQKLSKQSTVPFKKPELPIRAFHAPSTPSPPKTPAIHAHVRPQTPTDARRRPSDEPLPLLFSSPPLGDGRRERVQQAATDSGMLSSNSKPVPASPNAESTAISGHADHDEVDLEKRRGDIQTAKSDPFRQRHKGQKVTSFIRRLTGEGVPNEHPSPKEGLLHSMPIEIASVDSSDIDDLHTTATQSLPQHMPWRRNMPSPFEPKEVVGSHIAQVPVSQKLATTAKTKQNVLLGLTERSVQSQQDIETQALQSPTRKTATMTERTFGLAQKPSATTRATMEVARGEAATLHAEEEQDDEMEDSIITAPRQAVDNTQTNQLVEGRDDEDLDGYTTLINYDEGEQSIPNDKASPVRFRSSPPVPGSPSSHSSTSAEPESSSQPLLPTSEAEEMEWEASLQPHQRAIHDLLIRTSKRITRHIVDNETAVTDIAEIFQRDGEHILHTLLDRHGRDYDHVFQEMETITKDLKKELECTAKDLAKERRRINALA